MQLDPVDQFQTENQNGCLSTHKKGLIESTEKAQALILSGCFCEESENRQTVHKTIRKKNLIFQEVDLVTCLIQNSVFNLTNFL